MNNEERHQTDNQDSQPMLSMQEVLDCKRALNRMHLPSPDVDEAWERFSKKHAPVTPVSGRKKGRKALLIGFVSGVAASLLLLWMITGLQDKPSAEKQVQVFTALPPQDKVVLSTSSDEIYTFAPQTDSALHIHAMMSQGQSSADDARSHQKAPKWLTLTTPRGEDFRLTLPDGTEVWMNADSKLEFPETFTGDKREVRLYGEAYFDVARNEEQPFEVKNSFFTTSVLGTEFNVRAYSPEDAHVVLVQGKVSLQSKEHPEPQVIQPGQKAQWTEQGGFTVSEVDTYSYIQWKEGYFYFNNVPLVEIMQELGRWYNVDILFEDTAAMHTRFHFVADRNQDLGFALTNLNALKVVLAVQDEDRVIIRQ